ncbi:transposase [Anditalea andensis]|uniref:Uncharacterized protein n=1 Tax=Anditalea andensis TaxID=1048983 RepID=A0A074KV10_9BACT|nr:transposase [Anditalea andensis]KEO72739.1 hypothetical protein EL17_18595 [Anditalea andensis]
MYLQYFLGFSYYTKEAPFDPSMFVDIRKRLSQKFIEEMNEKIYGFAMEIAAKKEVKEVKKKRGIPHLTETSRTKEKLFMMQPSSHRTSLILPTMDCSTRHV